MPEILLTTLNAKYPHAAFGLRYLYANLGSLQARARLVEFDINQRPLDIVEQILKLEPRILGMGIYIWNVGPSTEVIRLLRRLRPELKILIGGPEVSYECEDLAIIQDVDHVLRGEADLLFARVCRRLLGEPEYPTGGNTIPLAEPLPKFLDAPLPQPGQLELPYDFYTDADCQHRIIYVEASRGCPYRCEYCLSSLDIPVRTFDLDRLLTAFQRLLNRGVRQFKFVDRTFNLNLNFSRNILQFFLDRLEPDLFLHFEMVPDRLPDPLRELILQFPPGTLQFEIGIQTLDPEVETRISRRQDHGRLEDNLRWLRQETGVHLHADLIVGLPGEDLEGFARGFDFLVGLAPQEIQVGILKRLRGTPIIRHTEPWGMVYSPVAPYEVLQTGNMDFATISRMRRFARFWDIYYNSGQFQRSLPLLWLEGSPFQGFLRFADGLNEKGVHTGGIALPRQYQLLLEHLRTENTHPADRVLESLRSDYLQPGRRDLPECLRDSTKKVSAKIRSGRKGQRNSERNLPKRQARHLGNGISPSPGPSGELPSTEE